jgi:hypothetical protein
MPSDIDHFMSITIRSVIAIGAAMLVSGCYPAFTSAVSTYNDAVASSVKAEHNRDNSALASWIKGLQVAGDPLGDYYWARLNENIWFKDHAIEDYQIRKFYESAAARGVEDAKLVLALKEFRSAKKDGYEPLWQKKLQDLDNISEKQCWFREPHVSLAKNELCVWRVTIASEVLEQFIYARKPSDPLDYWRQKNQACKKSQDYQEAIRSLCRPYSSP